MSEADVLLRLQARVLESVAVGSDLQHTLDELCDLVEGMVPASVCSVMLLDEASGALNVVAAPHGTSELVEALNGLVPSNLAGSCGTAVFQRQAVYVGDTSDDPRWSEMRDVARTFGIGACWSVPIFSEDRRVHGSFAVSHPQPREPEPLHREILRSASQLAGIAIDRRRNEQALRASEAKYHDLYDHAPDLFVSVEAATGRITECNQTVLRTLGYERHELLRRPVLDLYHPDCLETAHALFRSFVATGEAQGDLVLVCKDGRTIDVSLNASAVRDEQGHVLHSRSVWRDITRRKRAEEAVRRSQKLEGLGVLASGIAHDFNNLLVGISGNAELAMLSLEHESRARRHVAAIQRAATSAADLTHQLLAYAGMGKVCVEVVDLSTLVAQSADLLRSSVSRKVSIDFKLAADDLLIKVDATQVRQVLMNLVMNAAESTGDSPAAVLVRTGAQTVDHDYLQSCELREGLSEGPYAYVEVRDAGCGMDEGTIHKMFDPFFSTKETGRGLGLAATLGIMGNHHGTLRVESQPELGTTARVLFPISPARATDSLVFEAENRLKRDAKVLVVDDDPVVAEVTEQLLGTLGVLAVRTESGRAALEALSRSAGFDAVILDATMPGMDGEQTFRAIRELHPDLPVVFCSGYSPEDVGRSVMGKPHTAFLPKPFSRADLSAVLASFQAGKSVVRSTP